MPKRQSTAAQMARIRQAGTGEKYTEALRAVTTESRRFVMFSARGAGWDPITRRATQQLAQIWPGGPTPHWEEKFGDLCTKTWPWSTAPAEARAVLQKALTEAAVTCQTCPSPGRKRVVWIWAAEYGWVCPWVKTCCDGCYWVPRKLLDDPTYQDLFEDYEEPLPDPGGCCEPIAGLAAEVRAQYSQGGTPALLAKLEELRTTMWSRSPHYDVFSGHAVRMAVEHACRPLLLRVRQAGAGVFSEPLLPKEERQQVVRALEGIAEVHRAVAAEELRD
ncbi:hypothetical protein ABZT26_25555 [Streptomyces sp. NPDC005395]|uniref:hypothetical protein n=1 Tax=Streptomyces sp. NPDC005395 TaxID=3157042 RepID=UPI0033B7F250